MTWLRLHSGRKLNEIKKRRQGKAQHSVAAALDRKGGSSYPANWDEVEMRSLKQQPRLASSANSGTAHWPKRVGTSCSAQSTAQPIWQYRTAPKLMCASLQLQSRRRARPRAATRSKRVVSAGVRSFALLTVALQDYSMGYSRQLSSFRLVQWSHCRPIVGVALQPTGLTFCTWPEPRDGAAHPRRRLRSV